ncbi:hypothetical protein DRE_03552 [Drechslerella stenobrocha 248]|uniref:Uncharacterized protein n=1 Tax=Drechslerella stenobrocha 248 TaxID=1043628 RepID=W7I4U2_9PEZI|nr:hypothetical protein DRE_03552 [Drechslerella stenobrocha 248]
MVCEYAIFEFPDCGCHAFVPLQYCEHHLNPAHPAYDPYPEIRNHFARITMLFKGPAVPLTHEDYMWMIKVYNDPFLRNSNYTEAEMARLLTFQRALLDMCRDVGTEVKLPNGTMVPYVGFHTKVCRYHVIWPDCQEIELWRPSEPFFPFLETRCFTHSNCIRTDDSAKGWGIYIQPVPERFEEPFQIRYKKEWQKIRREIQDKKLASQKLEAELADEQERSKKSAVKVVEIHDEAGPAATGVPKVGYKPSPITSSEVGDEESGSEYEGGSDRSDSGDSKVGIVPGDAGNTSNKPKKKKAKLVGGDPEDSSTGNAEASTTETTTSETAAIKTVPVDQVPKKKKKAPKRKRNDDSDAEWRDDGESIDSSGIGYEPPKKIAVKKATNNPKELGNEQQAQKAQLGKQDAKKTDNQSGKLKRPKKAAADGQQLNSSYSADAESGKQQQQKNANKKRNNVQTGEEELAMRIHRSAHRYEGRPQNYDGYQDMNGEAGNKVGFSVDEIYNGWVGDCRSQES